ncbi:MAG: hypothetical protein WCP31_03970, partial [Chloroflexales bacterium]
MNPTDELATFRALREATTDPSLRAALDTAIAALTSPAPPLVNFGTNNEIGDVRIDAVAGRDLIEGTAKVSGTVHGPTVGVNYGTIFYASPN